MREPRRKSSGRVGIPNRRPVGIVPGPVSHSEPSRSRARGGRFRRITLDLSPLRESRDFRLLWTGESLSQVGSQITIVALFVQVYDLTKSSAAVGAIGLVQLAPLVVVSLGYGPQI